MAAAEAKYAPQAKELESIRSQFQVQQQEAARAKLSDKYGLEDDARWDKVLERRAADRNEYASEREAVAAACRHEFADEIIADYAAKLKTEHKARDKGQSTVQHGKTPPKAMTEDDRETQLLHAIMDGDMDKANRLGRRTNKSAVELMAESA